MQTCINGTWGSCIGAISPVAEVCSDNLDNDCDGLADSEDDNCKPNVTITNITQQSQEGQASCSDNIQNQDEEGIDCGGRCMPCEISKEREEAKQQEKADVQEQKTDYTFIAVIIIIIIIIICAVLSYSFLKDKYRKGQGQSKPKLSKPPIKPAIKKTPLEGALEKISRR